MIKLMIGQRVKVMVPTLLVAQQVFERVRDESGEGASTFPTGIAVDDEGRKYRISYNGRIWDGNECVS